MTYIPIPQPLSTTLVPPGGVPHRRYSRNRTIGTTYEMLDNNGAAGPQLRTTAAVMQVKSDSTSDTAAGVGARSVRIKGLNSAFAPLEEVVTMNGTTAVNTINSFIRINSMAVETTGTYGGVVTGLDGANIGTISLNALGNAAVLLSMFPQDGEEDNACQCVAAGFYVGISGYTVSVDTDKIVDVNMQLRGGADIVVAPFTATLLIAEFVGVTADGISAFNPPLIIPSKTDFYAMGRVSQGAADIAFSLRGFLAPNPT